MLCGCPIEAAQEVFKDSPDGYYPTRMSYPLFSGRWTITALRAALPRTGRSGCKVEMAGRTLFQRIGRGSVHIPNLSACITGCIQPDVIRLVAADSVDDGLLQRLLPVILQPTVLGHDEPLSDGAIYYAKLIRYMISGLEKPITLKFDDTA